MSIRGIALVAASACALGVTASGSASRSATSPICRTGLTTVERDPRGLLPLTADAVQKAAASALALESAENRPIVVAAAVATADRERGPSAKVSCGATAWRRTVVVYITRRAFVKTSTSISERVDFVGRFKDGYRVWQIVH